MKIWQLVPSAIPKLTVYHSAAVTAIVKCAQIDGLADLADSTCQLSFLSLIMPCFPMLTSLRELVSIAPLVIWTK